jgi:hypothetical protein
MRVGSKAAISAELHLLCAASAGRLFLAGADKLPADEQTAQSQAARREVRNFYLLRGASHPPASFVTRCHTHLIKSGFERQLVVVNDAGRLARLGASGQRIDVETGFETAGLFALFVEDHSRDIYRRRVFVVRAVI